MFQIEVSPNAELLTHSVEFDRGSFLEETIYGFSVKNVGRSIATGVQFQMVKIETRANADEAFRLASDHTYSLSLFEGANAHTLPESITLLPSAQVDVRLATEREDSWAIMPAIRRIPDYFEESHTTSDEYRFTVAVFDDKSHSASSVILISP